MILGAFILLPFASVAQCHTDSLFEWEIRNGQFRVFNFDSCVNFAGVNDWGDGNNNFTPVFPGAEADMRHFYHILDTTYHAIVFVNYTSGFLFDTIDVCPKSPPPALGFSYTNYGDHIQTYDAVWYPGPYDISWTSANGVVNLPSSRTPIINYNFSPSPLIDNVCLSVIPTRDTNLADTACYAARYGGTYSPTDWPDSRLTGEPKPIWSKVIPSAWRLGMSQFPGDTNGDLIEDRLAHSNDPEVDILLALNRCNDSDTIVLSQFGNIELIGKFIGVIALSEVDTADLPILATHPAVSMVFSDRPAHVLCSDTCLPCDTVFSPENGLSLMGIYPYDTNNLAHTVNGQFCHAQGCGAQIAIFDQGIDEELFPGLWKYKNLDRSGYDAIQRAEMNPNDHGGHGSEMAQLILGGFQSSDFYPGIAPGAKFKDIKVADQMGMGRPSDFIRGMEYVISQGGVKVALIPLSFPVRTDGHDPVSEMINVATAQGILCIVPTGNRPNHFIGAPGAARDALTVGNVAGIEHNEFDSLRTHPRNCRGSDQFFGQGNNKPELVAPGTGIRIDYENPWDKRIVRLPKTGSSYSAAAVAGIACLLFGEKPDLHPLAAKQLLLDHAKPKGLGPWDEEWGYGLVNAYGCLDQLINGPQVSLRFQQASGFEAFVSEAIDLSRVDSLVAGYQDTVWTEIKNAGQDTARSTRIRLWADALGSKNEMIFLSDTILDLPSGAQQVPIVFTSPETRDWMCFRTEVISYLDDTNDDNWARNNRVLQTIPPSDTVVFDYYVENPSGREQTLTFERHNINSACVEVSFDPPSVTLAPGQCSGPIKVTAYNDQQCCDSLNQDTSAFIPANSGCCDDTLSFYIVTIFKDSLAQNSAGIAPNGARVDLIRDSISMLPTVDLSIVNNNPNPCLLKVLVRNPCPQYDASVDVAEFDMFRCQLPNCPKFFPLENREPKLYRVETTVHTVDQFGYQLHTVTLMDSIDLTPVSDFTWTRSGNEFTFTDTSTGLAVQTWSLVDNQINSLPQYQPGPTLVRWLTPGSYDVCLETSKFGCFYTTTCSTITVGAFQQKLAVHPNPTGDQAILTGEGELDEIQKVTLFDLMGRALIQRTCRGQDLLKGVPLDLSDLPSGTYLIKVASLSGTWERKLFKL